MKPEEVIKTMEVAIAEVEWNYPMDYAVAFENAIDLIKKQIPNKVYIEEYVGQYDVNLGKIYYCPVCKNLLCFELGIPKKETEYCSSCGQALDWD